LSVSTDVTVAEEAGVGDGERDGERDGEKAIETIADLERLVVGELSSSLWLLSLSIAFDANEGNEETDSFISLFLSLPLSFSFFFSLFFLSLSNA
jgi:hypothetical protein